MICRPLSTAATNEEKVENKEQMTPDTAAIISAPTRQVLFV